MVLCKLLILDHFCFTGRQNVSVCSDRSSFWQRQVMNYNDFVAKKCVTCSRIAEENGRRFSYKGILSQRLNSLSSKICFIPRKKMNQTI